MQRNHLQKNDYKQFLVKNNNKAITKKIIVNLFVNFKIFHVFLVKVLNITSSDQNRNMHILYKKKLQS